MRKELLSHNILHIKHVSKTKICVWLFFALHLFSIWAFQHYMIEAVWAKYNVTPATVICLFILLFLLPFSLSGKLKIKPQWYSMIFYPSIFIAALLSQEHLTLLCVTASIVVSGIFVLLVYKLPLPSNRYAITNVTIYLIILVYYSVFADTRELTHYKYSIVHYMNIGQYDKALEIGDNSLHIDNEVFNLRTKAMLMTNTIGDAIFKYPIPKNPDMIQATEDMNTHQKQDVVLCNLLLQKKLNLFVKKLQSWRDIQSAELPQYYKEALVIYLSKTIDTDIIYNDPATQTDYSDFIAEMKKHSDRQIRSNVCRDLYPDTYFWYYFFFPSVRQ